MCYIAPEPVPEKKQNIVDKKKIIVAGIVVFVLLITLIPAILAPAKTTKKTTNKSYLCKDASRRTMNLNLILVMDTISNATPEWNKFLQDTDIHRLSCVDDALWIPGHSHSVLIVSLDGDIKHKTISGLEESDVNLKVLQINDAEIVVASSDGLYVSDLTGHIEYRITEGNFKDVATDSDIVLAAEKPNQFTLDVHKFTFEKNTLQFHSRLIRIPSDEKSQFYTLMLNDDVIYIADFWGSKIHLYNLNGELIKSYNHSRNPGGFQKPLVSFSDATGSVLVSDSSNNRFQVLTPDKKWLTFKIDEILVPYDWIVIQDSVYIWWQEKETKEGFQLSKYKIPPYHYEQKDFGSM